MTKNRYECENTSGDQNNDSLKCSQKCENFSHNTVIDLFSGLPPVMKNKARYAV